MLKKKNLIEKVFGIPYDEISPLFNIDYQIFISVMNKKFPEFKITKEDNIFYDNGMRFKPLSLIGVKDNNGWLCTGYHDGSTNGKNPFMDNEYYHIGFLSHNGDFFYQGVHKYDKGFLDDDRYALKPFPTHYIKVDKPLDAKFT